MAKKRRKEFVERMSAMKSQSEARRMKPEQRKSLLSNTQRLARLIKAEAPQCIIASDATLLLKRLLGYMGPDMLDEIGKQVIECCREYCGLCRCGAPTRSRDTGMCDDCQKKMIALAREIFGNHKRARKP